MEAIGALTGGIAHDFNNILTIIFGNLRLLSKQLQTPEVQPDFCSKKVQAIENAALRGADLVRHLMVFARQKELTSEALNVNMVIEDMMQLLKRSLGEMIDVQISLQDNLGCIDVDKGMLERVLINLCVNARDAMPDGGLLKIETKAVDIQGDDKASHMGLSPGPYIEIKISDTGIGIPSAIQQSIFDPFFTTKEAGKGTGLGLSMAYGFLKKCGGTIQLSSKLQKGSAFSLYIPASDKSINTASNAHHVKRNVIHGNETVLIVEDEKDIRDLTKDLLQANGYKVIEASNGLEALDILCRASGDIDLLFTDIIMPGGMSGVQLAGRAQSVRPELKMLFTSGYAGDAIMPDMFLARQYPFLDKPYRPYELMSKIRNVLD